jgi:hypothetical protein
MTSLKVTVSLDDCDGCADSVEVFLHEIIDAIKNIVRTTIKMYDLFMVSPPLK